MLEQLSFVASITSAFAAIFGLLGIWYQLKKQSDVSSADFLIKFNDSFENHKDIYRKLIAYQENKAVFSAEDVAEIVSYLTFFETLQYLLHSKVLTFKVVDDLFAHRFFIAVHNQFVQENELVKDRLYYKNIYCLYDRWIEYRKSRNFPIFGEKNGLKSLEDYHKLIG